MRRRITVTLALYCLSLVAQLLYQQLNAEHNGRTKVQIRQMLMFEKERNKRIISSGRVP